MNLKAQLEAALKRARELAAKSDLTDAELDEANRLPGQIQSLRDRITKDAEASDTLKQIAADGKGPAGGPRYLRLKSPATATRLAEGMLAGSGDGAKSLLPSGESVAPVEVVPTPIAEGRPAAGLLDFVPVIPDSPARFDFLRQTLRDLNAAPVAVGGVKPTSSLGLERVPGELKVVAHLSDPIDHYMLQDFAALEQFVAVEMLFGLVQAIEAQLLAGDGLGQNLTGILGTTGVLQQAFATDALTSTRKAITQLERQGLEPTGFVFAPEDWEAIELARTDSGAGKLELVDSPVDRAARRLHGVPVAVSAGLTAGQGLLLSRDAVALRIDSGIQLRWSENVGDSFERNEIRARAEVRAAVQVSRPGGVVVVDLSAA